MIEDCSSKKFEETINRIQSIKLNQLPFDIKLSMFIFSTVEDMEDLQKELIPELEIEQDPNNRFEFQTSLQNPFASLSGYQSSRLTKVDQISSLEVKEDFHIPNFRQSHNKQSMAEFMQNCIENQNNQFNEMSKQQDSKISKKKNKKQSYLTRLSIQIGIYMGFIRYQFLSHKNSKTDKEILIYTLTTLLILDICTMTFFFNNVHYARTEQFFEFDFLLVFIPFPFVIIITPFLGLILLANQAYGLGKAYLIFNFMALITMALSVVLTLIYIPVHGFYFHIFILKIFNLGIKVFISYCGKYSLLALNKLNKTNMYKK